MKRGKYRPHNGRPQLYSYHASGPDAFATALHQYYADPATAAKPTPKRRRLRKKRRMRTRRRI
jgi:hypothetical protein